MKLRILTSSSKLLPVDPPAPPEQFPESTEIIVFSRVAFDRTNKKALVYVGRICGPLGYLILLTESQRARKVEDKYLLALLVRWNASDDAIGSSPMRTSCEQWHTQCQWLDSMSGGESDLKPTLERTVETRPSTSVRRLFVKIRASARGDITTTSTRPPDW